MKKKLRLPAALAVMVLASSGCDGDTPMEDAGPAEDAGEVADAATRDAGECEPFEEYNPFTMMCEPPVV